MKISFRGDISYTIQAIKIIQDFIFCVFEIFLGHDPNFFLGHDPIWVMTEMGHDPNYFLGHDRDPVVTPNTTRISNTLWVYLYSNLIDSNRI